MKRNQIIATRIIRLNEVRFKTGRSRSSIYSGMKENSFPSSISIGSRSIGWVESEIEEWIQNQIEKHRSTQVNSRKTKIKTEK